MKLSAVSSVLQSTAGSGTIHATPLAFLGRQYSKVVAWWVSAHRHASWVRFFPASSMPAHPSDAHPQPPGAILFFPAARHMPVQWPWRCAFFSGRQLCPSGRRFRKWENSFSFFPLYPLSFVLIVFLPISIAISKYIPCSFYKIRLIGLDLLQILYGLG